MPIAPQDLDECRQVYVKALGALDLDKVKANAAFQAIEDTIFAPVALGAISSAIDTATAPVVLTAAQKKRLFAAWARNWARRF